MIFKNLADQDWIGFNFIGSGLENLQMATFLAESCNPITRQAIELESCSNPLRIQQGL